MPCTTLRVTAAPTPPPPPAPEFKLVGLVLHPSRIKEGETTKIVVTVRNVSEVKGRAVVEITSNRERIGVLRIEDISPSSTGSASMRYSPTWGTYEICGRLL